MLLNKCSKSEHILAIAAPGDILQLYPLSPLNLLKEAVEFVKKLAKEGNIILFVGTKPECKNAIEEEAKSVEMPYVSLRWIGGALTNLPEIKKRVNELKDLKDKKEKGELEKYTKKERLDIDKKIKKLERNFGGIVNMENKPDALFIVDPKHEHTAVKEAKLLDIPIVSLASSDCDISKIDYPIVANDSAIASISFFVGKIAEAYKEGKENMEIPKEAKTPTKQVEEQKN